ncbi:hypothetical protein DUNSADRAFT_590 [Dunaliella salina]|uniref:Encoded protein n=1 Tax=Dunaliella salina TaxID=3046 RepID=A0ABQ7GY38_DUNSA|nr:hypothetical protein DUNSADRAFT_590 [Dunaliella salina]|eukprot:KAF5839519.1 hypothetical protein DUNSADRAFT_590 [Dunaliella salina]
MGCVSSQPEPKASQAANASKHGSSNNKSTHSQSPPPAVRAAREPPTPDFGCNSHYQVMTMLGEGGSGKRTCKVPFKLDDVSEHVYTISTVESILMQIQWGKLGCG